MVETIDSLVKLGELIIVGPLAMVVVVLVQTHHLMRLLDLGLLIHVEKIHEVVVGASAPHLDSADGTRVVGPAVRQSGQSHATMTP